ncbi:MAG TPA: hypothetical protein VEO74_03950 [Thermoanaerobaculia bacterium]|nr:hypothetical protein [Thermoanaerobaculia bacterium]
MRRPFAAILLLFAACAAQQLGRKSPVAQPEIVIEQLSSVAPAARNVAGGISVHYRIRVRNVANEPVTLKRVDLVTIGYGSYNLGPLSRPFDVTIKSGSEASVEVWAPAQITDPSVAGANGPVTLRAIALFDSPAGQMQSVVTQQVRSATAAD